MHKYAVRGLSLILKEPHIAPLSRGVSSESTTTSSRAVFHRVTGQNTTFAWGSDLRKIRTSLCNAHFVRAETTISPEDVSFVSFVAEKATKKGTTSGELPNQEDVPPALRAALSSSIPSFFKEEEHLDSFSRSRVVNFLKRYVKDRVISTGKDVFHTEEVRVAEGVGTKNEASIFHSRIQLPLRHPDMSEACASGELWAHGVACNAKSAELLAAMHAERIIDELGYHIYTLPSMQRKHAAAARKAGRFSPSSDEVDSGHIPQAVNFPPPLRRVLIKDESEGGKWQLVDVQSSANFVSPPNALLSPCVFDPKVEARVRLFYQFHGLSLAQFHTIDCEEPKKEDDPAFFVASITIPPELIQHKDTVMHAQGKAITRENAISLACMHVELVLDALNVPIFPQDDAKQKNHAMTVWSFGRPAPLNKSTPTDPSRVATPLPLKELHVGKEGRFSVQNYEEALVYQHSCLGKQITDFIETRVEESTAIKDLQEFLKAHQVPRAENPFFHELIHGTIKSTVVLPLPEVYGIRGGVGISTREADANTLAAMHALDVLTALNIPVKLNNVEKQALWEAERAEKLGLKTQKLDPTGASPPGRRLSAKNFTDCIEVTCGMGPSPTGRYVATPPVESLGAKGLGNANPTGTPNSASVPKESGAQPPVVRRKVKRARLNDEPATPSLLTKKETLDGRDSQASPVPTDYLCAQKKVSREHWSLHPDTSFGYILVAPKDEEERSFNEMALRSPRSLDCFSKERVLTYLASVGRRFEDVFTTQPLDWDVNEEQNFYRCTGRLPVPRRFGDRVAIGEAPSSTDAMHLAAMHAELILDALGICLFTDAKKQQRHAETCAEYGRWAPRGPNEERPAETVSPPPLRREYTGSAQWEREQERRRPTSVSRLPPPTASPSREARPSEATTGAEAALPIESVDETDAATPTTARVDTDEGMPLLTKPNGSAPAHTPVLEDELDPVSKPRVQYYLRRQRKLMAVEAQYKLEVRGGAVLHSALWNLPLPEGWKGEVDTLPVQGIAPTKRDAEVLSWMHAERLLDALGIPIFDNLPKYQAWHAKRVKKLGRSAPTVNHIGQEDEEMKNRLKILVERGGLPPLRLTAAVAKGLNRPCFPEGDLTEDVWGTYVDACASYISDRVLSIYNDFFAMGKSPRSGSDVMDQCLEEVEALPVDVDAKMSLKDYCNASGTIYPVYWRSQIVGPSRSRISWTTVLVPGFEYLQAQGVGMNKEMSERRAAMHVLAVLSRVDPNYDFHAKKAGLGSKRSKPDSKSAANGAEEDDDSEDTFDFDTFSIPLITTPDRDPSAAVATHDNTAASVGKKTKVAPLYDIQTNEFTTDGKIRLVELFTLCQGVMPPKPQHQVRYTDEKIIYSTKLQFTDDEENVWTGEGSGEGLRQNEHNAYLDLFWKLEKGQHDYFNSLKTFFRQHLWMNPRNIIDIKLTSEQKKAIHDVIGCVPERVTTDETVEGVPAGTSPSSLPDTKRPRDGNVGSFLRKMTANVAEESHILLQKLQEKLKTSEYVENYAKSRAKLNIHTHKEEIVQAIEKNSVVIVCGTTGCGKTTQVPQFILDHLTLEGRGGEGSIVVTQPRRLSAVSIAQRVAAERLERIGDTVGYIIRFDSIPGKHINFCTSGVLLRILNDASNFEGISYLIIDEIHERDINSDFLLILLRDIIKKRPDLHVILMSATLQADQFANYFWNAPIIYVEGYAYPVQELYIEDLAAYGEQEGFMSLLLKEAALSKAQIAASDPMVTLIPGKDDWAAGNARSIGSLKYNMKQVTTEIDYPTVQFAIEQAVRMVDLTDSSVLVFLPGWEEIVRAKEILERNSTYHLILLHSSVGQEEQMRCFLPAPEGKIKVILSTNIAESGVTIDDVGAVIDIGHAKEKCFTPGGQATKNGILRHGLNTVPSDTGGHRNEYGSVSQLLTVYASRANCVQRRGRVGRTRPGVCIRLYSRKHFEQLHDFQTPEMLRTPLDFLCLLIIALRLGDPKEFLGKALEPPTMDEIEVALKRLHDLDAITSDVKLTALGQRLSLLPVEPRMGKVILMGVVLRCLDSALTTASLAEVDVFMPAREYKEAVRLHREDLSKGTRSDVIASINGYNYWVSSHHQKQPGGVVQALESRLLSVPLLLQMSRHKSQFYKILYESGFLVEPPEIGESKEAWAERVSSLHEKTCRISWVSQEKFVEESSLSTEASDVGLVKCVIASGLLPNLAMNRFRRLMDTKMERLVCTSPDSVIHRTSQTDIKYPFFVYTELSKTAEARHLVLRGLTNVSLWTLLLMGASSVPITFNENLEIGALDGWIYFRTSAGTLGLIKKLRRAIQHCFAHKFSDPHCFENNQNIEKIRMLIKNLVGTPIKPNGLIDEVWTETGTIIKPTTEPSCSDPETVAAKCRHEEAVPAE